MSNKIDTKTAKSKRLGRGLDALLGGPISLVTPGQAYTSSDGNDYSAPSADDAIQEITLDNIDANPWQPRTQFEQDALEDLAQSVRELGIITPITVRRSDSGRYQIVSGERRYRAARIAQLNSIPAYIVTADDRNMRIMAVVENIQREDLNPIDIAAAYQNLMDEYELTQDNISYIVGKKRATVANYLRLLKLPVEIQRVVQKQTLSMGHAKVLMGVENTDIQKSIAQKIIDEGLSVRQVEDLVKDLANPAPQSEETSVKPSSPSSSAAAISEETLELLTSLKKAFDKRLHGKTSIKQTAKGGMRITLDLDGNEDIKYIIAKLTSED